MRHTAKNNRINLKLSHRRPRVLRDRQALKQMDEVRSADSYISQNDLRVHFGLGEATQTEIAIHGRAALSALFRT
jgi:hypothetical protein